MWAWLGIDDPRPRQLLAKRRSGAGRSKALSYLFFLVKMSDAIATVFERFEVVWPPAM
jgi:hypothetical protein